MRTGIGRVVTGKLVQNPETGYWKEEVTAVPTPRIWRGEVLDVARILQASGEGMSLREIGVEILRGRQLARPTVATLYRTIDKVLLEAGIREKAEVSRKFCGRDPNGSANLPAAIEELL